MAAAAPLSGGLSRGLAMAAEAKKQIKITGLETDLLRVPAAPYSDGQPRVRAGGRGAGLPRHGGSAPRSGGAGDGASPPPARPLCGACLPHPTARGSTIAAETAGA